MEDIIFTCLVSIICLALILISYRFSKGFFYKNIVVYFLYNGVLYYKLFFILNGEQVYYGYFICWFLAWFTY